MSETARRREEAGTVSRFRVLDKIGEDLPDTERKRAGSEGLRFRSTGMWRTLLEIDPIRPVQRVVVCDILLEQRLPVRAR
jgi:hypothetical protein